MNLNEDRSISSKNVARILVLCNVRFMHKHVFVRFAEKKESNESAVQGLSLIHI